MLNMNLAERVVIDTNNADWQPSPAKGVERKLLEREEAEQGRATSIVRYQPGTAFNAHTHPLGEEILVLDGVFSDEHGDYPKGTYLRNPPGSVHSPFSKEGCTLLVKLHQFQADDTKSVRVYTEQTDWQPGHGALSVMPLHSFNTEHVALVKWPKGSRFIPHVHAGGEEIYVISGCFEDEFGAYPKGTWLRSPHMSQHHPFVNEDTVIWVKTGHL